MQDPEIKFGYAVTGAIDPARMLANAGARAGDVLFLTKPLGTGIVGTAIKFDRVESALADEAVRSMRTLNRAAAEALQALPAGAVHACTDITGFGLIGHATEMAKASGVTIVIGAGVVPLFSGVLAIAGRTAPAAWARIRSISRRPRMSSRASTGSTRSSCTTRKPLAVC